MGKKLDTSMLHPEHEPPREDMLDDDTRRQLNPLHMLRRLDKVEHTMDTVTKLGWLVAAALVGLLVKDVASGWQISRVPQAALPAPTGVPTTAADFVPRPKPPAP